MSPPRTLSLTVAGGILLAPLVAAAAPASAEAEPPSAAVPASQVVLDWQRTAVRTVYTENASPPPVGALYHGFTSLAMFDAVDWAQRRGSASVKAAAAQAGHDVLAEYFPTSTANLEADLATTLAAISPSRAKAKGIRIGARAADRLIADRADDGRGDPNYLYQRDPAPGIWQPPATGMLAPWLGYVDYLALRTPVPVDGPDPLDSAEYAADYEEVRLYGGPPTSPTTLRSAEQTQTALFYNANIVLQLTDALADRLQADPVGIRRTARLFAAVHAAGADSLIACWRAKYEEGFWRPFQAIPAGDTDGNPATVAEPGWTPLVPTPPYPDYFSGHASFTGSAVEVIRRMLGEHTQLTVDSSVTGTSRTYPRLSHIEEEALHARIWLGIHFRDAMADGYQLAHTTARRVLHTLR